VRGIGPSLQHVETARNGHPRILRRSAVGS
jgi:hypothetical protein